MTRDFSRIQGCKALRIHIVCRSALAAALALASAHAQTAANGFIFAPLSSGNALPGTHPDNHASTVVELKGGDVMVAWFAGTKEGAPDVAIYGARLHRGAWSAPVELARAQGVACWNPVLFHTKDGRLWLYYKYGTSPGTWLGARKVSRDEGLTWSAEEHLPAGILGPIKDKPLVLSDGAIVSGSSVEAVKWTAWIERSTDDGMTWTKIGPITIPDSLDVPDAAAQEQLAAAQEQPAPAAAADAAVPTKIYPPANSTVGIIQPTVVQLEGNHLRFYARSRTRSARIAVADSFDSGKTWTQAHFSSLPNPNSGIDAVRLRDGRVVLAFNNSYNKRTPLNLAASADGEHFRIFRTLEDGPGQYSYPAIVLAANGDLLITYSWRRETIKFVRVPRQDVPPRSSLPSK
jgi:predicted neuraminidase